MITQILFMLWSVAILFCAFTCYGELSKKSGGPISTKIAAALVVGIFLPFVLIWRGIKHIPKLFRRR